MPSGTDPDQTVRDDRGVDNDWSGSLDGTSDLNNCNGTLQVGSC